MSNCGSKKMKYGGSVRKMDKGGPATPKVLPKRKPKATATSTNMRTGATRGAGDDKEYMRKAAAANMKEGGKVISDADEAFLSALGADFPLSESGRTISDADRARIGSRLGGMAPRKRRGRTSNLSAEKFLSAMGSDFPMPRRRSVTDIDRARIAAALGATDRQLMGMEDGGAVPKKYKGFSKLPERVQQKINPDLAGKYEDGGEVRGMGRAYQGKPRGCKIR